MDNVYRMYVSKYLEILNNNVPWPWEKMFVNHLLTYNSYTNRKSDFQVNAYNWVPKFHFRYLIVPESYAFLSIQDDLYTVVLYRFIRQGFQSVKKYRLKYFVVVVGNSKNFVIKRPSIYNQGRTRRYKDNCIYLYSVK